MKLASRRWILGVVIALTTLTVSCLLGGDSLAADPTETYKDTPLSLADIHCFTNPVYFDGVALEECVNTLRLPEAGVTCFSHYVPGTGNPRNFYCVLDSALPVRVTAMKQEKPPAEAPAPTK